MEEAAFGASRGPRDGLQNLESAAAWWHHGRKGLDCKNLVKGESGHTNHEVDESGRKSRSDDGKHLVEDDGDRDRRLWDDGKSRTR